MATKFNNLENGTNGSNIAGGGSANGQTGFNTFFRITGGTLAYDNTYAAHGNLSVKVQTGSTAGNAYVEWNSSVGTLTDVWFRFNMRISAAPPGTLRFFRTLIDGTGNCFELALTTGRQLRILNISAATVTTFAQAIPINQWIRIEGFVHQASTDGIADVYVYNILDAPTPWQEAHVTGQNFRGASNTYRFGVTQSLANLPAMWFDDLAVSDIGWIGAVTPTRKFVKSNGVWVPAQIKLKTGGVFVPANMVGVD